MKSTGGSCGWSGAVLAGYLGSGGWIFGDWVYQVSKVI